MSADQLQLEQKIEQINRLLAEVCAYKTEHPEACCGYTLHAGSILNAYREGDISFDEAVWALDKRIEGAKEKSQGWARAAISEIERRFAFVYEKVEKIQGLTVPCGEDFGHREVATLAAEVLAALDPDRASGAIVGFESATDKIEKLRALLDRWNRVASAHGPCGSEFHDEPERVFERVLETRQSQMRVIAHQASEIHRINRRMDELVDTNNRDLERRREAEQKVGIRDVQIEGQGRMIGKYIDCCAEYTEEEKRVKSCLDRIAWACVQSNVNEAYYWCYVALVGDMTKPAEEQAEIMRQAIERAQHAPNDIIHKPGKACAKCGCSQTLPADLQECRCECHPVDRARTLEDRTAEWVRTRIGPDHMQSRERAMRLLEEAIELAQAEGITLEQVTKQAGHVFARPVGEALQEAAGVAVTLLGWCAAHSVRMINIAKDELDRIERKPIEQIRGSIARKNDADLFVCATETEAK